MCAFTQIMKQAGGRPGLSTPGFLGNMAANSEEDPCDVYVLIGTVLTGMGKSDTFTLL